MYDLSQHNNLKPFVNVLIVISRLFVIVVSLLGAFFAEAELCPSAFAPNTTLSRPAKQKRALSPPNKQWTAGQQTAFLAYQQALKERARSFLLIAPFSKENNLVMAHSLVDQLIIRNASQKPNGRMAQKLAIVAVPQASSVDTLARTIEEVNQTGFEKGSALDGFLTSKVEMKQENSNKTGISVEYSKTADIKVINWNTGEKDLALVLSPSNPSIVVMTHYKLKHILSHPDSENYDLLSSNLSIAVLRIRPLLDTDLIKSMAVALQQNTPAFIYGMATSPLQAKDSQPNLNPTGFVQGSAFKDSSSYKVHKKHEVSNKPNLFAKTHWAYLNTKEALFQEPVFQNPTEGMLKQFSAGVRQGELTPWTGLEVIHLSKEELPGTPLWISENPRTRTSSEIVSTYDGFSTYNKEMNQHRNPSEMSINPAYYPVLARKLSPTLRAYRKGVLITSTKASAERLVYFLSDAFPEISFAHYSHRYSHEEKQVILKDSHEARHHYIVTPQSFNEIESLPHLSAYIDLNVHSPLEVRLSMASPVLSLYPGKTSAKIILLNPRASLNPTAHKPASFEKGKGAALEDSSTSRVVDKKQDISNQTSINKPAKKRQARKLPFEEALQKARTAKLPGLYAYREWQKDHPDMPYHPNQFYLEHWKGWRHFLGNEKLSWEQILQRARAAKLTSMSAYHEWQKKQPDMPVAPDNPRGIYRNHWVDWSHFLGYEKQRKLPWEQALKKARSAGLPGLYAYLKWQKDHSDMPSHPDRYKPYAEHWKSWGHFLGYEKLPWEQALKKVRSAKLSKSRSYPKWQKNQPDIPSRPDQYAPYAKYWRGWRHFLGNEKPKLPWEQALKKVRSAQLQSVNAYYEWRKNQPDMPSRPDQHEPYAEHWKSWTHFLGHEKLPYEQALQKVRSAKLTSWRDYQKWQKNQPDMPSHPDKYAPYAEHWKNWPHFLGYETPKLSFEEALQKARAAHLPDANAYRKWQKRHPDMLAYPEHSNGIYRRHWKGWRHFLGNEKLPWEQALKRARAAKLSGRDAYQEWQKNQPDMPSRPDKYAPYAKHWQNWAHFLGNEKLTWEQALRIVHSAQLSGAKDYRKWRKNQPNMPYNPDKYEPWAKHWRGWTHFLGKHWKNQKQESYHRRPSRIPENRKTANAKGAR